MSNNGNKFGAFFSGIFLGALVGAVIALLFAPEGGDELRRKIQSGVEANWQKASQELDRVRKTKEQPQGETQAPAVEG